MRLIHLTDPHLTDLSAYRPGLTAGKRWLSWLSWRRKRRFVHRRDRLDALVEQLAEFSPDLFAVTGDLCQIGLEQEMLEARDWLESLESIAPVQLVPGNHDLFAPDSIDASERLWSSFYHRNTAGSSWPGRLDIGPVQVIGVNTSLPTAPLLASGRIGPDGLKELKLALDAAADQFSVVLLHHPPLPGLCSRRKALSDDRELTDVLKSSNANLVLYGHLHRNQQHALQLHNGQTLPILCTASASSTHQEQPASARLFEILPLKEEQNRRRYSVEMKLLSLDASSRLEVKQETSWQTA